MDTSMLDEPAAFSYTNHILEDHNLDTHSTENLETSQKENHIF